MTDRIERLREAIRQLHGCEPSHVGAFPVIERFKGKIVWQGLVEMFDIQGHPTAKRCYAWSHENDDGSHRSVAVLELPPVYSPVTAVRASIVSDMKSKRD